MKREERLFLTYGDDISDQAPKIMKLAFDQVETAFAGFGIGLCQGDTKDLADGPIQKRRSRILRFLLNEYRSPNTWGYCGRAMSYDRGVITLRRSRS